MLLPLTLILPAGILAGLDLPAILKLNKNFKDTKELGFKI